MSETMDGKKERYEVIMAGSGGQGLVVSGIMLAEAAILEGKNVVQTVSYGIATRGGFSMAEVIIDREEIIFQQVQNADVVLALTEEAMEKFQALLGRGTTIVYDTTLMKQRQGERLYGQPFTDMASRMGHVGMANIIALGCMAKMNGMVGTESLAEVIRKRFTGAVLDANLKALQAGGELAAG
ncbi:MAG: 2-oxoacid:acceptor oxidoreductase family protein [Syntrophales bacterium]